MEKEVTGKERGVKRPLDVDSDALYPKALKEMCGALECKLCNVTTNSTLSMYTHYKGKTHQKKVNKYLRDHNITVDSSSKKTKTEFVATVCKVCDVSLTSELQSLQHYAGKMHKKKVASQGDSVKIPVKAEPVDPTGRFGIGQDFNPVPPPPPPPPEPDSNTPGNNVHFCSVCSIFTTSSEALTAHMMGSKHRKKVAFETSNEFNSLTMYRTPSNCYYCPVCDLSGNAPEQFIFHLRSKKHLHNSKKKLAPSPR